MTDKDKRRKKPAKDRAEPSKGQYGGLKGGLGPGGGRDIEELQEHDAGVDEEEGLGRDKER